MRDQEARERREETACELSTPGQTWIMLALLVVDVTTRKKRPPEPTDTPVLRAPSVPAVKLPPKR